MKEEVADSEVSFLWYKPLNLVLIDKLDLRGMKSDIILPYLNTIYDDLLLRFDMPDKGIPRITLINVRN